MLITAAVLYVRLWLDPFELGRLILLLAVAVAEAVVDDAGDVVLAVDFRKFFPNVELPFRPLIEQSKRQNAKFMNIILLNTIQINLYM